MRTIAEEERKRTSEALRAIYEQTHRRDRRDVLARRAQRFTEVLQGMKQMAAEMQRELDATRTELRRGILELPQETAESAAQMRRVIVDQIEALAELNRIVARHGRGLDAAEPARAGARRASLTTAGGRGRERRACERPRADRRRAPRAARCRRRPATSPARRRRRAAPNRRRSARRRAATAGGRTGWLSDLLHRASRTSRRRRHASRTRARAAPPRRRGTAGTPLDRVARLARRSTSPG